VPKYHYSAFDISGLPVKNSIMAPNRESANAELERLGLLVSSLRTAFVVGKSGKRVSPKILYQFNKELTVLVRAGVPLAEAISLLSNNNEDVGLLSSTLSRIYQKLVDGEAYSAACAVYPDVFDPVYIAAIQMGEHTGRLDAALESYQLYLARRIKIEAAVKQALAYPIFLLGTLMAVFAILFIVVIPKFSELYESFDAALPVATQIVLSIARGMPWILLTVVALVSGALFLWRRWDKPIAAYQKLDDMLLRIPIAGPLRASAQQSRCMRMIGGLLAAGTSLLAALNVTRNAMARYQLGVALQSVGQQVESGRSFTDAVREVQIVNQQSIKMLQVGEKTGALTDMLNEVADYYESKLDEQLARFTALFEPILMVFIGVFIGAVILAMYMPIFFLAEVVQ
jgi:type IV pilus assembly protein PilC